MDIAESGASTGTRWDHASAKVGIDLRCARAAMLYDRTSPDPLLTWGLRLLTGEMSLALQLFRRQPLFHRRLDVVALLGFLFLHAKSSSLLRRVRSTVPPSRGSIRAPFRDARLAAEHSLLHGRNSKNST